MLVETSEVVGCFGFGVFFGTVKTGILGEKLMFGWGDFFFTGFFVFLFLWSKTHQSAIS